MMAFLINSSQHQEDFERVPLGHQSLQKIKVALPLMLGCGNFTEGVERQREV